MAARFSVVFSDDPNAEIDRVVVQDQSTKVDVLREALQPGHAARDGKRRALMVGLVHPGTQTLDTEMVGLCAVSTSISRRFTRQHA